MTFLNKMFSAWPRKIYGAAIKYGKPIIDVVPKVVDVATNIWNDNKEIVRNAAIGTANPKVIGAYALMDRAINGTNNLINRKKKKELPTGRKRKDNGHSVSGQKERRYTDSFFKDLD